MLTNSCSVLSVIIIIIINIVKAVFVIIITNIVKAIFVLLIIMDFMENRVTLQNLTVSPWG